MNARRVGGSAAHAVMVGGKIIRNDPVADNDHRVDGEAVHPTMILAIKN